MAGRHARRTREGHPESGRTRRAPAGCNGLGAPSEDRRLKVPVSQMGDKLCPAPTWPGSGDRRTSRATPGSPRRRIAPSRRQTRRASWPVSAAIPRAAAPFTVAATMASAADIRSWLTPRVNISGKFTVGDVPGLKSVASATAAPAAIRSRAGARAVFPRNSMVPGSSVATVGAAASAATPAAETAAKWSADVAPSSAANSAPPAADNSSAWSLSPSPDRRAASRIVRDSPTVKTPGSQNTSAKRASRSPTTLGSISRTNSSTYSRRPDGRARNSSGISCAPSQVGHDAHRQRRRHPSDRPQGLELILDAQPISRLDFDRRGAVGAQPGQTSARQRIQLVFRSIAQIAHRSVDPAALRGNGQIVGARRSELLFVVTGPPKHAVGVRVHQAGGQYASGAVDPHRFRIGPFEIRSRSDRRNALVGHGHGGALSHAGISHLHSAPRTAGPRAGHDLRRVDEEERHGPSRATETVTP